MVQVFEVAGKKIVVDSMVYLNQFIKSNMEIVDKLFMGYPFDFDMELVKMAFPNSLALVG